jgi:hypothetical protein
MFDFRFIDMTSLKDYLHFSFNLNEKQIQNRFSHTSTVSSVVLLLLVPNHTAHWEPAFSAIQLQPMVYARHGRELMG